MSTQANLDKTSTKYCLQTYAQGTLLEAQAQFYAQGTLLEAQAQFYEQGTLLEAQAQC